MQSKIHTKWLLGMLAAVLMLAVSVPVSQAAGAVNKADASHYLDVPDKAWYAEAVNDWITRGILNPKQGDRFEPGFIMTRGDFAFLFAYSLGLSPSEEPSTFKDVKNDGLAGYITALQEAGLAHGFPDGTFRSNLPVTRAEAASWIAAAKKLTIKPQSSSPFRDVTPKSWYAGAVNALTGTGIISGKAKDRFAPNETITRAETITFLYRSFYKSYLIEDIGSDGTIKIDGHSYHADESVKGLFHPSNKTILHHAAIQFTHQGNTIVSVETLIIGYKGALAGQDTNLLLNAQGNAINGTVIVDADKVTLSDLVVKGDLYLAPSFQTNFTAQNLFVKGETVYLEDAGRPNSQLANISFQTSDLGKLILENSANVKQINLAPDQLSKSYLYAKNEVHSLAVSSPPTLSAPGLYVQVIDGLINLQNSGGSTNFSAAQFGFVPNFQTPPIILPQNPGIKFTPPPIFQSPPISTSPSSGPKTIICENARCDVDAYVPSQVGTGSTGSIGTITVHSGTSLNYTGSTQIDTLTIGDSNTASDVRTSFSGTANINHVIVNGNSGKNTLTLQGTIGTLEILDTTSRLSLPGNTRIDNLIVPIGVEPKSLFANPNDLSKVSAINGQPTVPTSTPPPSTPSDNTPPNGLSIQPTAIQKIGSTTHATLSITDTDAAQQGVDHYRVFVAADAEATPSDPYWQVHAAGDTDIDLTALEGGVITPSDGQTVQFTVVAYDSSGNSSVPTNNDKASVKWDKSGPSSEGLSVSFNDTDIRANYIGGTIQIASSQSDVASFLIKIIELTNDVPSELDSFTQGLEEETLLDKTYVSDMSSLQIAAAPVDLYGNAGTTVIYDVTDWSVPAPTELAQNVIFTDTDQSSNISGTLSWTAAQDETSIESYEVYLLDSSNARIGNRLESINKGSEYAVFIPDSTVIPDNAAKFGVYSKNAGGESELAATVEIVNDVIVTINGVTSLSVVQNNEATVNLTITDADAEEQGVSSYRVFIAVNEEATEDSFMVNRDRGMNTENTFEIDLSELIENDILHPGDMVHFTVKAVNDIGTGSNPASADKTSLEWAAAD